MCGVTCESTLQHIVLLLCMCHIHMRKTTSQCTVSCHRHPTPPNAQRSPPLPIPPYHSPHPTIPYLDIVPNAAVTPHHRPLGATLVPQHRPPPHHTPRRHRALVPHRHTRMHRRGGGQYLLSNPRGRDLSTGLCICSQGGDAVAVGGFRNHMGPHKPAVDAGDAELGPETRGWGVVEGVKLVCGAAGGICGGVGWGMWWWWWWWCNRWWG